MHAERPRFEGTPSPETPDETSVNLHTYFNGFNNGRLADHSPSWTGREEIEQTRRFRCIG